METLFPQDLEGNSPDAAHARLSGPFAAVALENSVDRELDYAIPPKLAGVVHVGQRVKVPLGRNNRPALGYVVAIRPTSTYPKIKHLHGIDDPRVLISTSMMNLARWMSRYYVSPLGTVIDSILPAAVKKKTGLGTVQRVQLAMDRAAIQEVLEKTRAPKRRAILARLLQMQPDEAIDIARLAGEAGSTVPTVRKLAVAGLIRVTTEIDLPGFTQSLAPSAGDEAEIVLNEDQKKVVDDLGPRAAAGGFSVNLLHGVTGSGKTEVYLQVIRRVIEQGRQAIVLVPEIALTPQTVKRFTARFPRVAILHSGLTATQRHQYWQQISQGDADVVVGARSAIFAPTPRLGIVVVDEEHEASYKQDTAPRYNARDVAVKRCQLEGAPVLLGSATPSLESWYRVTRANDGALPPLSLGEGRGEGLQETRNAERGTRNGNAEDVSGDVDAKMSSVSSHPNTLPEGEGIRREESSRKLYHLLSMPRRVRGLQLPPVELVNMLEEVRMRRGVHLMSQRLEHMLRYTIERGQQAILLLNRRGYSNFVYCPSCTHLMQCKYCDTTLTYHRSAAAHARGATSAEGVHTGQLHCHYCLAVNPLPEKCPECGKKLSLFGLGTQRVEEEIARKFPGLRFARVDSDSMHSAKDYEATLGRFARGEIQLMLGTQMIAKGLDYPNVTLVGVISGDTALALPDFRSAERTFQLITQVAGRAGRGEKAGRVILQTFLPDDPTIRAALRQDFVGFAKTELHSRREVGLPPVSRMARIILRDQDVEKLNRLADKLASQLAEAVSVEGGQVRLKGPMPCAIGRIAGYFRHQIILTAASAQPLQRVLAAVREKGDLAKSKSIAVDVDPTSLL